MSYFFVLLGQLCIKNCLKIINKLCLNYKDRLEGGRTEYVFFSNAATVVLWPTEGGGRCEHSNTPLREKQFGAKLSLGVAHR